MIIAEEQLSPSPRDILHELEFARDYLLERLGIPDNAEVCVRWYEGGKRRQVDIANRSGTEQGRLCIRYIEKRGMDRD